MSNAAFAGRKEGPMAPTHVVSAPFAFEPAEPGGLSGHGVRCSCGYVGATSLSAREAAELGHEHAVWARKAGK